MNWTENKVIEMAPDPNTAQRGARLATPLKWTILEKNDSTFWGLCKGSGKNDYKVAVSENPFALTCSCPVRKKPCKHLIALLLLYCKQQASFKEVTEAPSWLTQWHNKQKAPATASPKAKVKNVMAQTKNRKERIERMKSGMKDLEGWLEDLIREGLASTAQQTYRFWQDISARMVDAQLGAIGPRIRNMQMIPNASIDWTEKMLKEIGDLYLLLRAFDKFEELEPAFQDQLLRLGGVKVKKAELLAQKGIVDDWAVIGQEEGSTIDNIEFRQTWFRGRNQHYYALVVDYSFLGKGFENNWGFGNIYRGEMVYYPSLFPMRSLLKEAQAIKENVQSLKGKKDFQAFLEDYAAALAQHPWLKKYPCCLENVRIVIQKEEYFLVDKNRLKIPLQGSEEMAWTLMSISGAQSFSIFGEWNGENLLPLSTIGDNRIIKL